MSGKQSTELSRTLENSELRSSRFSGQIDRMNETARALPFYSDIFSKIGGQSQNDAVLYDVLTIVEHAGVISPISAPVYLEAGLEYVALENDWNHACAINVLYFKRDKHVPENFLVAGGNFLYSGGRLREQQYSFEVRSKKVLANSKAKRTDLERKIVFTEQFPASTKVLSTLLPVELESLLKYCTILGGLKALPDDLQTRFLDKKGMKYEFGSNFRVE